MKRSILLLMKIVFVSTLQDNTIVGRSNLVLSSSDVDGLTLAGSHNNLSNTEHSTLIGHNSTLNESINAIVIGNENSLQNSSGGIVIGNQLTSSQDSIIMGKWNVPTNSFFVLANGTKENPANVFEITKDGDITSQQILTLIERISALESQVMSLQTSIPNCTCVALQYSYQQQQCCVQ